MAGCSSENGKINREELVQRHIVHVNTFDSLSSLSVGNGRFAFTVDFTGLQTFPEMYEKGIPLGTQSEWGWHSFPNTGGFEFRESMKEYDYHGRKILYDVQWMKAGRSQDAANYFRQNPHRLHLGMIGLDLLHADGTPVGPEAISSVSQMLNPWNGEIVSRFKVDGIPVEVITCSHQELDLIAVQVKSELIEKGLLRIKLHFPFPSGQHTDSGCDWSRPDSHTSVVKSLSADGATFYRQLDASSYTVKLAWKGVAELTEKRAHEFILMPGNGQKQLTFTCLFAEKDHPETLPDFNATVENSTTTWKEFWLSGGAVDFSGSTDPRASELERRVILSQYLTRIQCTGKYPPQETGLTCNSWFGKFHLEMHWWHAVHFGLWGRADLLKESLDWYADIAEKAGETAKRQGFEGLRWPKMTDPGGMNSPSSVGSFLIWQQPHFIYLAELCFRNDRDTAFLKKYAELIDGTADFMASYAWYDSVNSRYVLGPALIPAQERFPAETTINPPFELTYWYYGLTTAMEWRKRMGFENNIEWEKVRNGLPMLSQKNGLYLAAESAPDSYSNPRYISDHPMALGVFGMMPGSPLMDTSVMKTTFDYIWKNWHWTDTWGWDFPMTAMAATRLGMPEKAVDALFMDVKTNTYLVNGHNYQDDRLRLYLPGNGALLAAVAMMCAGYDGADTDTPGFPKDGTWKVKWEGLQPLP
ncbi:MAG: hypothetical protein JXA72_10685 [Bacteroidales bacterium]|nr:hypothetical protein [Bacteroidales bacterium]